MRFSIQPSRVGIDAGSVEGDSLRGSGILPISTSILVESMVGYRSLAMVGKGVKGTRDRGYSNCAESDKTVMQLIVSSQVQ